ncbi:PhoH family protein [Caldithrix abyssi DSM 13497]|uniref:PhoH-like protein n=1 Tax=Caldithrix abyssi DSM 13497 TaxID=880073 RepID=H1XNS8_CALAY|nr:PhoH family protein [Caldithrix abyssi]APF19763.1 phosphate starvation-inducible protein PhoH [Caldithrix abyssi DSM 13497]EHO39868.1 PhoH family protein [Caldithrix abyssi DSM 13497]
MEEIVEKTIKIPEAVGHISVVGEQDSNLRILEENFQVRIIARGNTLKILGKQQEAEAACQVLEELIAAAKRNKIFTRDDVLTAIKITRSLKSASPATDLPDVAATPMETISTFLGYIKPRTEGQRAMMEALNKNDIVFAVGPAGTGKTYLAVALAVAHLKENLVKKIVLARPAVEAGESLGFLPGDYKEKIDPYLKPLYDALEDMLPRDLLKRFLEQQIIEILPLAYMRGRTLNNAFVILDEAQNTTFMQMKMFLTRLGINSKSIITGDITQIDLPTKKDSGLVSSFYVLSGIEGIAFVKLTNRDVVRHPLVKDIIDAYERYDEKQNSKEK